MANLVLTAELVIYAILILPTLYCLFKHLRTGAIGWTYLIVFCSLRIIGGGLSISDTDGEGASIISSVALSPLLLAATGILHEVRVLRNPRLDPKVEWIIVLVLHMVIGAGVALAAVGISNLYSTHPKPNSLVFVKAGLALLFISWVAILALAVTCFFTPAYRQGKLLFAATFSIIWIGVRVIYTLIAFTTEQPDLKPITGSLAVRVVLGLLPELIATLSFLAGGFFDMPDQYARVSAGFNP